MTTEIMDIEALDAAYQAQRAALVTAGRQAELARQQRVAQAAARLRLDKEAERLRAVQNHWSEVVHAAQASEVEELSRQCKDWREKVALHLAELAILFEAQPRLKERCETALWETAKSAWVAYATNPRSSPQLAWQQVQAAVNDLVDDTDLRTSNAVVIARSRLATIQMREIVTAIPIHSAFDPPKELQRIDHAKVADGWLAEESPPN